MPEIGHNRYRIIIIILLVLVIISGGIIILIRYEKAEPLVITRAQEKEWEATVYIGGTVNLPGYYPCTYEDTIESLIQAAGGLTENAGTDNISLIISLTGDRQQAQKIDINRAEVWLLEALPEIGEILAERIVEYRTENGLFKNTMELMKVEGVGTSTYEKLEKLVTVNELP